MHIPLNKSFLFDNIYGAAKKTEKNGVKSKSRQQKKLEYGF